MYDSVIDPLLSSLSLCESTASDPALSKSELRKLNWRGKDRGVQLKVTPKV